MWALKWTVSTKKATSADDLIWEGYGLFHTQGGFFDQASPTHRWTGKHRCKAVQKGGPQCSSPAAHYASNNRFCQLLVARGEMIPKESMVTNAQRTRGSLVLPVVCVRACVRACVCVCVCVCVQQQHHIIEEGLHGSVGELSY